MTAPIKNIALARETRNAIREYASAHNQLSYVDTIDDLVETVSLDDLRNECGSTACFAGWVCALSGDVLTMPLDQVLTASGEYIHTFDRARHLLGLTDGEAVQIFFSFNVPDMDRALEDVFGEAL